MYIDGANRYEFVEDSPVGLLDPLGTRAISMHERIILNKLQGLHDIAERSTDPKVNNYAAPVKQLMDTMERNIADAPDNAPAETPDLIVEAALWIWAISDHTNPNSPYSEAGELPESTFYSAVGSGQPKCNSFVADALSRAIGLLPGNNGTIHTYPYTANEWADGRAAKGGASNKERPDRYTMEFRTEPAAQLSPGDIIADPGKEHGHVGVYIGSGLYVSATDEISPGAGQVNPSKGGVTVRRIDNMIDSNGNVRRTKIKVNK